MKSFCSILWGLLFVVFHLNGVAHDYVAATSGYYWVFEANVALVPEPEGLLKVSLNHLDKVVAASSELEG